MTLASPTAARIDSVLELLQRPLLDLVHDAAAVHRSHHDPHRVQCARLLSVKTGGCPEDCGYCSQSAHWSTDLERERLLDVEHVQREARRAKQEGADRFCIGAAWRSVRPGADFDAVLGMVRAIKAEGLEACATLGMLEREQADALREAGLDYYNHNLDSGRSHYGEFVTTRDYDDRLRTLRTVREAGLHVCCGGILGLGEQRRGRAELLQELANLDPQPESVPVNTLVQIEGTPMEGAEHLDWTELVRVVAAARVLMPKTAVRLSAGRTDLDEATQAMCFLAGANSMFVGDELLTTPNPAPSTDAALLKKLAINAAPATEDAAGA